MWASRMSAVMAMVFSFDSVVLGDGLLKVFCVGWEEAGSWEKLLGVGSRGSLLVLLACV